MSLHEITIPIHPIQVKAFLTSAKNSDGVVLFAHGCGSSRHSPRNQFVAKELGNFGISTLLADLLTDDESVKSKNVFDIDLLSERLIALAEWIKADPEFQKQKVGYFGASTGGAAALQAAAKKPDLVTAIVSRGGRPDLANQYLSEVVTPTLLIVGEKDKHVTELNRWAYDKLDCVREFQIIPHAGHLFSETGTLEHVATLTTLWFKRFLSTRKEKVQESPKPL
jgi:dienelactone hydrolase